MKQIWWCSAGILARLLWPTRHLCIAHLNLWPTLSSRVALWVMKPQGFDREKNAWNWRRWYLWLCVDFDPFSLFNAKTLVYSFNVVLSAMCKNWPPDGHSKHIGRIILVSSASLAASGPIGWQSLPRPRAQRFGGLLAFTAVNRTGLCSLPVNTAGLQRWKQCDVIYSCADRDFWLWGRWRHSTPGQERRELGEQREEEGGIFSHQTPTRVCDCCKSGKMWQFRWDLFGFCPCFMMREPGN